MLYSTTFHYYYSIYEFIIMDTKFSLGEPKTEATYIILGEKKCA